MYSENPWIIISYPLGLFIINYFEIPIGISGCAQRKLDDDDDVHAAFFWHLHVILNQLSLLHVCM